MAAPGFDQDGGERFYRHRPAIQLDLTPAFEHEIDLREFFVVVTLSGLLNIDQMDARGPLARGGEGPARQPAGTRACLELIELRDQVVRHAGKIIRNGRQQSHRSVSGVPGYFRLW